MIVAILLPRFPLLVALRASRIASDTPAALGPLPGAAQVVGTCTVAAEAHGVHPGLRVGEAMARCPRLVLVSPDPDATEVAHEQLIDRLERLGAAVEPGEPGIAWFDARGLTRLYGGLDGVIRRARRCLPVGVGGRIGAAPTRFAALQAAHEASAQHPLVIDTETAARDLLAPLPIDRLPLDTATRSQLCDLGLRTIGAIADLPRAAALERLGFRGFSAWRLARGEDDRPLRPRCPPRPLSAQYQFPDPVGALPVLHAAARLLLGELAVQARGSGRGIRAVHTRARLTDGGSWTHRLALREATTDPERLAVAVLPALADVTAPVDVLAIQVDASGVPDGRQLTLQRAGHAEQLRRTGEAIRHIRATVGDTALLRVVELEPWSHLPERKWALVPFDISPHLDPSV
ncbi:MAG: DNA polymerase Y family protein [Thermoleophilia bacterium]|nr:DNA polymerase Y family protein [Thermoleophilia bacterium]